MYHFLLNFFIKKHKRWKKKVSPHDSFSTSLTGFDPDCFQAVIHRLFCAGALTLARVDECILLWFPYLNLLWRFVKDLQKEREREREREIGYTQDLCLQNCKLERAQSIPSSAQYMTVQIKIGWRKVKTWPFWLCEKSFGLESLHSSLRLVKRTAKPNKF